MSDLDAVLELFATLFVTSEVSAIVEPRERAERIWAEILTRDGVTIFVSQAADKVVATCMLITVPNLLRGGRDHAFLENVVTHPDFRAQGYGRAVVQTALAQAWADDCYHVLLQSGRADPRVHRFYESCGFVPGVRVGYVAHRPI